MNAVRILGAAALALILVAGVGPHAASGDEGWTIERFDAQILVHADGSIAITEAIDVDFGAQQKHGIFRRIPVRYHYDERRDRVYDLRVRSLTDQNGRAWRYDRTEEGADVVLKIGDPDRTVSGRQSYRIVYDVTGVLNGFTDHDELFWNANGVWPVRTRATTVHVQLEHGDVTRVACYQGVTGSTEACRGTTVGGGADMASTRLLGAGEQMTVVAAFPKGVVPDPRPVLATRTREITEWWDIDPLTVGGSLLVLVAGIGLLLRRYLQAGRDPGGPSTIVPEYEPPEKLRPAEVGLLFDEFADTKDLTATIVDLAVKGYLRIEEVAGHGFFAGRDWTLSRIKAPDAALAQYERRILEGLFATGTDVRVSGLKGTFHTVLHAAEGDLYSASVANGWFPADPSRVRILWAAVGVAVMVVGAVVTAVLGSLAGAGLVGTALVLDGALVLLTVRAMPRRTAKGRDLLWHSRGFRRYMETAETDRQRFAERENVFAAYLPYAIVFGLVSRWAAAFKDIDMQKATQGWYAGPSIMNVGLFSSGLSSFSGSLGMAISSTPGSSGASGFGGGGGAGGGGGGGGGGSW